jgi:PPOX class probable F420-dependent enzyme
MNSSARDQFDGQKYINLETFRKNGAGVVTPVWFAEEGGVFYVYSLANAGKVKRIRNNSRVRVMPSDIRGNPKGEWVEARARILDDEDARHAHKLLDRKYGLVKRIGHLFGKLMKRQHAAIGIELA